MLISHGNITRRKMAELDLERQASEAPLTGLANRARFTHALEKAISPRSRRTVAGTGLLYLDLDGFKPVNDTFGHCAGDEVLQVVAARLLTAIRPPDTAARLGGDEFAVVVPRIDADGLTALADRIGATLAVPHLVHGHDLQVGASIGACLLRVDESAAEFIRRADEAMYLAKRNRPRRS